MGRMKLSIWLAMGLAVTACKKKEADKAAADPGSAAAEPSKETPKATPPSGGGGDHAEAELQLNKLGKSAKMAFATAAELPKGTVALTPATACCSTPEKRCAASPADWADPTWKALEFSLDEAHDFQYSYTSDGKTFTATAVGDPGCTGTVVTYKITGATEAGNLTVSAVEK